MHSNRILSRRLLRGAVIALLLGTAAVNVTVTVSADPGVRIEGSCPALYVLGVQGGEEGDVATGSVLDRQHRSPHELARALHLSRDFGIMGKIDCHPHSLSDRSFDHPLCRRPNMLVNRVLGES